MRQKESLTCRLNFLQHDKADSENIITGKKSCSLAPYQREDYEQWTRKKSAINTTHSLDYHSHFCLVSQLFIIIDKMLLPGSIYLTVAISIERYVTVCHPFYRLHFEFLNFKFNILIQILSISLKCHSLPPILQVATLNLNSNVKYN